jgi:hypothetical protein
MRQENQVGKSGGIEERVRERRVCGEVYGDGENSTRQVL